MRIMPEENVKKVWKKEEEIKKGSRKPREEKKREKKKLAARGGLGSIIALAYINGVDGFLDIKKKTTSSVPLS